jgi:hypothetical protein
MRPRRSHLGLLLLPLALLMWATILLSANTPTQALTTRTSQQDTPTSIPAPTSSPTPILLRSCWTIVPSPNAEAPQSQLLAVHAISSDDVWAVGNYVSDSGVDQTLTMHWDGQTWSIVPSPNVGTFSNGLRGVAGVSSDVWAVGYSWTSEQTSVSLIMHWDGLSWVVVTHPTLAASTSLASITALANDDIWAVGYYYESYHELTLTMHWDGTGWAIVPSPSPGGLHNNLLSISAVSTNDIWAVGIYNQDEIGQTLALHGDGISWTVVPTPRNPTRIDTFRSVAALAQDDVWAVGDSSYEWSTQAQTLVGHWDGTTWAVVPSPNIGALYNYLTGVSAISPNNIWAVGYYADCYGCHVQTLMLNWDGIQWSLVSGPSTGSARNQLNGIAVSPGGEGWTVGLFEVLGLEKTLIERNNPVPFQDVPIGALYYSNIRCLACLDIVSGYECGDPLEPCPGLYFRPYSIATRGQISKIISNAASFSEPIPSDQQTFEDVPSDSPFWIWVERLSGRDVISGYPCGGEGEPCEPGSRPYFRPGNDAIRGHIAKLISNAAGIQNPISSAQRTFEDVPGDHPFWLWIGRLSERGIISGYECGVQGEPCLPPDNRPYFRPSYPVTRGQMSKIVANALFPDCGTYGESLH